MVLDYHRNTAAFGESIDSEDGPVVLHDPACILYALEPECCTMKKVFCDIELSGKYSHGLTVIDINDRYRLDEKDKNMYLVFAKDDTDEHFRRMFIEGIKKAV
ncbi:MAG: hypothetical protein IKE38_02720 [Erysipelotrichaceae bacterium]|nr:hypothetical protein [Erysipelotrichaceae bacterium]